MSYNMQLSVTKKMSYNMHIKCNSKKTISQKVKHVLKKINMLKKELTQRQRKIEKLQLSICRMLINIIKTIRKKLIKYVQTTREMHGKLFLNF